MQVVVRMIVRLHREDSGQDLLEYALVLGTVLAATVTGSHDIAALIANGMTTLGNHIATLVS